MPISRDTISCPIELRTGPLKMNLHTLNNSNLAKVYKEWEREGGKRREKWQFHSYRLTWNAPEPADKI